MDADSGDRPGAQKPAAWDKNWDFIEKELPEFPAAFFKLIWRDRPSLDPKTMELIAFASNGALAHFFEPGFLHHARAAAALGATKAELLAVTAVIGTMGVQSFLLGASIYQEELAQHSAFAAQERRMEELRVRHVELLGAPIPEAERAMHADPGFYADWLDLAATCFGPECALTPRVAHLVAIAAAAQCTQLSSAGVRQHIRGALAAGATPAQVLEVCQFIVGIGGHALLMGTPLLIEEFGKDESTDGA